MQMSRLSTSSSSFLALFLALMMFSGAQVGRAADARSSCVSKFREYFSEFFEVDQVDGYADAAMGQIIIKANSSKIVSAVIDAAWNNLTSSQYSTGSSLLVNAAMEFGSYSAINETIEKCVGGAAPVLLKLYPKISAVIDKSNGESAKMNAGFEYADGKFKLPLCKKLVAKCKAKLTADEWSKGSSLLKNYIKFSTLGYTVS